jgi:hypothetical protein
MMGNQRCLKRHFRAAILTLMLSSALPAAAADLTPSAILADPSQYDGKSVTVVGSVAKYQTSKTLLGTVAAFQLCDAKCIVVIDETNTLHKDGDSVTLSGTFQTSFKGPRRSFKNVVLIK